MDISVVICTYNRSRDLDNVLKSLALQQVPDDLIWEIVVVDNNSKDDTKDVVEDFKLTTPIPVTYSSEEKQGLSHARNRGSQRRNDGRDPAAEKQGPARGRLLFQGPAQGS